MKQCYKCKKKLKNKTQGFIIFEDGTEICLCDDCIDKFIELFLKHYSEAMEGVLNVKK